MVKNVKGMQLIRFREGFTLIELMIVIAVVSIIMMVAFPSYQEQVRKARRADAQSFLLDVASRQERFYTQNVSYTSALTASTGLSLSNTSSPEGHYTIGVTVTPAGCSPTTTRCTGFTLTATAAVTDPKCSTLTYNSLGVKGYSGSASSVDECW